MSLGWLAAIIVFASIGCFIAMIVAIALASFGIYKTGRYAYKDMQPWMERFREFGNHLAARSESLQAKGVELAGIAEHTTQAWGKTLGIAEEIKAHPLVRVARRRAGRLESKP